jgi:hypothetical protein
MWGLHYLTVKIAGLGAGMTEAIIVVTPSETIKYAYADLNYVLLISFLQDQDECMWGGRSEEGRCVRGAEWIVVTYECTMELA